VTQKQKIEKFRRANIEQPSNVKFIPIDFNENELSQKLERFGCKENIKSLHVLEGLTMYLDQETIDALFNLLKIYSAKESMIVFDYLYASVLRRENTQYGEKTIVKSVSRQGEEFRGGIEKGHIREFLSRFGFELIEEFDADELEKMFFTDVDGRKISGINGTHGIAIAKRI
jgi:methyltransferase (TIGR00027 family)